MSKIILPRPGDSFEWVEARQGPALVCRPLEKLAHHFFTTRPWALGSPAFATATASTSDNAWAEVAAAVDVDDAHLLRVRQVHGAAVVVHRAGQRQAERADADIVVSDDAAVAVAVQTADCVPLLMADERTGAVAAAHAGWRGTALRVAAAAVTTLTSAFGSRPSDLVAAVGPSIGACCYQVDATVRDRFAAEGFSNEDIERWFLATAQPTLANQAMAGVSLAAEPARWFLDLWSATRDQLEQAGLRREHIHVARLCTASHRESFCSYRRDGQGAGRLAAVVRKLAG